MNTLTRYRWQRIENDRAPHLGAEAEEVAHLLLKPLLNLTIENVFLTRLLAPPYLLNVAVL